VKALDGSVTAAVLVGTLIGGVVYGGIKWWYGDEGTESDPVADGNASQWVTPDDPVVQAQAGKAALRNNTTGETKPLDDPDLASWLESAASRGEKAGLVYTDEGGNVAEGRYNTGKGSSWQKPADYFAKGTEELGPVSGDCTDTTVAAVSVFPAKGFRARGVYGYGGCDKSRPHAWGEVVIGGKLYRIDETGYVINPESDPNHYTEYQYVTDADDPRYRSMWDDRAQQPYDPDWWKSGELAGDWSWTGVHETNGVYDPSDRAYVYTFKQEAGGYALYYADTYTCPVEFDGRNVSFVTQLMGNAEWTGVLEGDSITGTQVWEGGKWEGAWQATRVLVSGRPR